MEVTLWVGARQYKKSRMKEGSGGMHVTPSVCVKLASHNYSRLSIMAHLLPDQRDTKPHGALQAMSCSTQPLRLHHFPSSGATLECGPYLLRLALNRVLFS